MLMTYSSTVQAHSPTTSQIRSTFSWMLWYNCERLCQPSSIM